MPDDVLPSGAYQKGEPLPEDKFVEIGRCPTTGCDITLCYNTFGDSHDPCLLLVSGMGSPCTLWRDNFCQLLVDAGFYVVRFDNRDSGLSTHLNGITMQSIFRLALPKSLSFGEQAPPYTLDDLAADAWKLLSALEIRQAHLLGGSMGGMVVQCMAIQQMERVLSLTIVYAHCGGSNIKSPSMRFKLSMLDRPASMSQEDILAFKMRSRLIFMGDYELNEPEVRAMMLKNMQRAAEDPEATMRQVWATQRSPGREEALKKLSGFPTLIIHGMKDLVVPMANGMRLAQLIPGARLVVYARMGHSIPEALFTDIVAQVNLNKQLDEETSTSSSDEPTETDTETESVVMCP